MNTVSWLREVIERAYQDSLPQYGAHKVRGIASTLLFERNFSLDQVLKVGVLRSQIIFTSFYLRDITHKSLDTFFLGPVMAAQSVVWLGSGRFLPSSLK